jgi:hypothetical protein
MKIKDKVEVIAAHVDEVYGRVECLVDNLDRLDNSPDWTIFRQSSDFILDRYINLDRLDTSPDWTIFRQSSDFILDRYTLYTAKILYQKFETYIFQKRNCTATFLTTRRQSPCLYIFR